MTIIIRLEKKVRDSRRINEQGQEIDPKIELGGPTGGMMVDYRDENDPTRMIDAMIAFIPNKLAGAIGLLSKINSGSKTVAIAQATTK